MKNKIEIKEDIKDEDKKEKLKSLSKDDTGNKNRKRVSYKKKYEELLEKQEEIEGAIIRPEDFKMMLSGIMITFEASFKIPISELPEDQLDNWYNSMTELSNKYAGILGNWRVEITAFISTATLAYTLTMIMKAKKNQYELPLEGSKDVSKKNNTSSR